MERRSTDIATSSTSLPARWKPAPLPAAIYRELVAALFTMRLPIIGLGVFYVFVSTLIFMRWPDRTILVLTVSAVILTMARLLIINGYHRAGGSSQTLSELKAWERRYAAAAFAFALLLAGLNIRVLSVHQPLMHTGAISLVFTFGAGVVSRTFCRPYVCVGSLLLAVVPTAVAMVLHATTSDGQSLHGAFFLLFTLLLLAVAAMSLSSVHHLHAAAVAQLIAKQDLAKLARHDVLTGLPNRLMLRDAFRARLEDGSQVAIHYLDLDGFKAINDQFGHPAGDELLRIVAARLLATVRAEDVASRLGGDEFVLIQGGVRHKDEAELLARRVIKHLSDPYVIAGVAMRISVSVGIALAPDHGAEFDELVGCADEALYQSKAGGKAQLRFYEGSDPEQTRSAA